MKKVIKLAVFLVIVSLVVPAFSNAQTTGATGATQLKVNEAVSSKTLKALNKAVKKKVRTSSEIEIVSPNGGESLVVGGTYSIEYKAKHTGANTFNIYLTQDYPEVSKKKGINSSMFIGSTADSQRFSYTIPASIASWPGLGGGYRIMICGVENSRRNNNCTIRGISDESFKIVRSGGNTGNTGPTGNRPDEDRITRSQYRKINIKTPNGGEMLRAGETYKIKWTGGFPGTTVDFSLLTNDGGYSGGFHDAVFTRILSDVANDGEVEWTVPEDIDLSTYKLLVEFEREQIPSYVNWYVESWDFSDEAFEIGDAPNNSPVQP
jgi:hypothetical protein